jgi:phosphatidylglycerophosphate synthase
MPANGHAGQVQAPEGPEVPEEAPEVPEEAPEVPESAPEVPEPSCGRYRMAQFEHPGDLAIVRLSSGFIAFMREVVGLTPNHVTMLSILCSIIALVHLWHARLVPFVLAAAAAYWFDDLDGAMARRYAMGTKLGEYLDHLSDLAFFVGIIVVLVVRYGALRSRPGLMLLLIFSALLPATHNACAARACGKDDGAIGLVADLMCPLDRDESAATSMRLRWIGGPGYQLLLYALVPVIVLLCSGRLHRLRDLPGAARRAARRAIFEARRGLANAAGR